MTVFASPTLSRETVRRDRRRREELCLETSAAGEFTLKTPKRHFVTGNHMRCLQVVNAKFTR